MFDEGGNLLAPATEKFPLPTTRKQRATHLAGSRMPKIRLAREGTARLHAVIRKAVVPTGFLHFKYFLVQVVNIYHKASI